MTASPPLIMRGHIFLPIVQSGLNAGTTLGTIARLDLRHHHAGPAARMKPGRDTGTPGRLYARETLAA
ncbi:MAG: hypothetical protein J0I76_14905 [Thiobacillus sp.]|nr:hypothetical protein [Thiobacillus sp.]